MNSIICPNCNSNNIRKFISTYDYFLTMDRFDIYDCSHCNVLFTYPIPEQEVLYSKYYKSDNYLSHNKKSSGLFSLAYRVVQKINIRMKLRLIERINDSKKKKILEIGAGTGDFIASCRNRGWDCVGVEPSEQARAVAKEFNGLNLMTDINRVGDNNFSIIVLWHVLEHIPDINKVMSKLRPLLSDDGAMIIAVPNHNSFDAKHYKQFWAGYDVPRHLYHFNKSSLAAIMESNGFQFSETTPMKFDSFYVSLLSEKYAGKLFIFNALRGIFYGALSNFNALFNGEYSSLIFTFRKAR
jgi:2-polyprenyl-3-methyl-5-hydroxy-6-metoxy-1,4-benzoquinol methylase